MIGNMRAIEYLQSKSLGTSWDFWTKLMEQPVPKDILDSQGSSAKVALIGSTLDLILAKLI